MKGWRREKYLVIVVWEAFLKMLINVVIYQKASLKETSRVCFNLISLSLVGNTLARWNWTENFPVIS